MKIFSIIKAAASGLIWGLGQILNKQFLKGIFFLIFFAGFVAIELGTSNYFNEIDPYSRITGEDFILDDEFVQKQIYTRYSNYGVKSDTFEEYIVEIGGVDSLTGEKLIQFIAQDLTERNQPQYTNLINQNIILKEDMDDESKINVFDNGIYYFTVNNNERTYFVQVEEQYLEVNILTGQTIENGIILNSVTGLDTLIKTNEIYRDRELNQNTKNYFKVTDNSILDVNKTRYLDMNGDLFQISSSNLVRVTQGDGPLYLINNNLYEYFEVGLFHKEKTLAYRDTTFTIQLRRAMRDITSIGVFQINDADYTKYAFRIYLELNPSIKNEFEANYDHFFYDRAGQFTKGFWGLLTLGQVDNVQYTKYYTELFPVLKGETGSTYVVPVGMLSVIYLQGHVSRQILLQSLISLILLAFFLIFMIWSIRDAYSISEAKRKGEEVDNDIDYFKSVYENGFEYIVLSPALFVLAFISIMPILFGFLVAFTSMSGPNSMGAPFEWVGFKNFLAFFNFNEGLGSMFGRAFWSVLGWTVIWAIASTITVFFGGFLQALIVNGESVVFRKFWRTIFIIPWAMPAILSQMIFSVMFKDSGWLNQFLQSVGVYELLTNLRMIGVNFSELEGIRKLFFLGTENIEWFSNVNNPTFVKATLIVVNIWLGFPYFMALMSGVMTAIDKSLYEAADIDGATKTQKTLKITFPLVLYSTAPILIMTLSGNFNNFGVIYFITQGGPNLNDSSRGYAGDTDILISWMYKLTTEQGKGYYNIASVFSVLIFIFVGSITAWNLTRTRAFKED